MGPWCSSPVGPTASADGVTVLEACVSWAPATQVPLGLPVEADSDLSAYQCWACDLPTCLLRSQTGGCSWQSLVWEGLGPADQGAVWPVWADRCEDTALAQPGQSRKDRGPRAWPDDLGL